jgi:hypothetical protein
MLHILPSAYGRVHLYLRFSPRSLLHYLGEMVVRIRLLHWKRNGVVVCIVSKDGERRGAAPIKYAAVTTSCKGR